MNLSTITIVFKGVYFSNFVGVHLTISILNTHNCVLHLAVDSLAPINDKLFILVPILQTHAAALLTGHSYIQRIV